MKEIYKGKDNYGNLKSEYLDKLSKMNEEDLFDATRQKIWLSAYANNNSRSDYHWQADACYDEWKNRGKLEKYNEAWKKASNS